MEIDRGALEATNLFFVRALSRTVLVIVFSSDSDFGILEKKK